MALADYVLFLDDERDPAESLEHAVVVRNYQEFVETIEELGIPRHIAFDHDIGDDYYNGKKCAEYLAERFYDQPWDAKDFTYSIHSQNPVGAENIRSFIESMKRHFANG